MVLRRCLGALSRQSASSARATFRSRAIFFSMPGRMILAITGVVLLGAVVGLWPFQDATPPQPGDRIKGREVTAANAASFERKDWPLASFDPSTRELGGAFGLIGAGLAATLLIGRLDRASDNA